MIRYLNSVPNEYRDALNKDIMVKAYDRPLHEYVFEAFKGFEIIPNIKILDYEYDEDESNYDQNDHIVRRNKNKNKVIKSMNETRCGVMYLKVEINGYDDNGKHQVIYLNKPIIIPVVDDKGYMMIKNKKCYLIFQLVDKMLYPSFGTVTIKSLMPICIRIKNEEFIDTDDNVYIIPTYTIQIFKSSINVLLIYSHLGINKTLNFLEIDRFIRVDKKGTEPKDDKLIQFDCGKKSDIIISVIKDVFEREIYIRTILGCLIQLLTENKTTYDEIDDIDYWMILVGGKNTVKRGRYQHIFFNRLLDDITKNEMKINDYDKQNIYYLLKYIIGNFHALWAKDNLSMINKRLRCNEYLSSLITQEISRRINRINSLGDRAKISDFYKCFKFPKFFGVSLLIAGNTR